MITIQKYVRPKSLEEAYELNQQKRSVILGGMHWLKMQKKSVSLAIDLGELGLDRIEEDADAFYIGAGVTLRELETHRALNEYACFAVERAMKDIVGVQFRNTATVGGSLWSRFGFSDVLTLFLSMDSYVELFSGGVIPLREFAAMKADRDLLIRLIVKKRRGRFVYGAFRRQQTDLPVLNCALSLIDGKVSAVIGARPARGIVLADREGILSGEITEERANAFGEYAASSVETGSNLRASAEYRSHLIRVLLARSAAELGRMI